MQWDLEIPKEILLTRGKEVNMGKTERRDWRS